MNVKNLRSYNHLDMLKFFIERKFTFMIYEESNILELKEQLSNTFLKTVCAFANDCGGEIIFGVNDSGKVVGVKNFQEVYPKIERKIFDSIKPIPYFSMEIDHAIKTIKVIVEAGEDKPYFYKQKTYIRRNTSTIEADNSSLKKMILETKGITFENSPADCNELTFNFLENEARENIGVDSVSDNFLKTCGLINKDGNYNNAAILFSDQNNFWGIDTVKYNPNSEKFKLRKNFSQCSVLKQLHKTIDIFNDIYSFEKIDGINRNKYYQVPIKAFREALVNAIIHRDWEISSNIKVTFFDDRVEILSPGLLPKNISKNEFLNGFVSVPRNYILCSLFRRLGYVERMGYGISLIKREYQQNNVKPRFEFLDNFINVILPVTDYTYDISEDEKRIMDILKFSNYMSSSQLATISKISRTKVVALCNALVKKGFIKKSGTGRGTKYSKLY